MDVLFNTSLPATATYFRYELPVTTRSALGCLTAAIYHGVSRARRKTQRKREGEKSDRATKKGMKTAREYIKKFPKCGIIPN